MRTGRIIGFDVMHPGTNYTAGSNLKLEGTGTGFIGSLQVEPVDGNITGVAVSNKGMGYDGTEAIVIEDANGSGAVLRPVIGGNFYLEANFTNADGEFLEDRVRLLASRRNELTEREAWLDLHLDNFSTPAAGWWTLDSDGDG